jgi:hypothetical protein
MSKATTFIASTTRIAVAHGKMNWNTAIPAFRTAMQYRYDAAVKIADKRTQAQADIKTIRGMIDFCEKSAVTDSREIEKYNAQIADIEKNLADANAEFIKNAPAETEAEKNLYYAYKAYVLGTEDEYSNNTYVRAFYEWADSIGVAPTLETFNFINKKIGMKKLSAKGIVKANGEKFTDALTKSAFYSLFWAVIMECLKSQNLLRGYTFECDFAKELAKKAAEKAAKTTK